MTPSLMEYIVPTALDMPDEFKALIMEEPYPTGPYGAKGVGEHATDATPAAILNAIHDAVGVRLTRFPAAAERIHRALQEKERL